MRWVSTLGLLEGGGRVFPDWGRKGAKLTREVPPRSSSLFFITASHVSSFHQRTRRRTWTSEGRRKKGKDVHLVVWEGLDVHAWIDRRMTRIRSRRKKPRDTMPVHAPHVLTTTNRRTRRSSVLGANVKKDMRRLPRKGDPCPDTSQKGDQTNPRVEKKKKDHVKTNDLPLNETKYESTRRKDGACRFTFRGGMGDGEGSTMLMDVRS